MEIALGSFALLIKNHWQRSRPTMYAALEREGTLEERVAAADRLTRATLAQLLDHGMSWPHAWALARCEWMIFPVDTQPVAQSLGAARADRPPAPPGRPRSLPKAVPVS